MNDSTSRSDLKDALQAARKKIETTARALDNSAATDEQYGGAVTVWSAEFENLSARAEQAGEIGLQLVSNEIVTVLGSMEECNAETVRDFIAELANWIEQAGWYLDAKAGGEKVTTGLVDQLLSPVPDYEKEILADVFSSIDSQSAQENSEEVAIENDAESDRLFADIAGDLQEMEVPEVPEEGDLSAITADLAGGEPDWDELMNPGDPASAPESVTESFDEQMLSADDGGDIELTRDSLLEVLQIELADLEGELNTLVDQIGEADKDSAGPARQQYSVLLQRFLDTCRELGLSGLVQTCEYIQQNCEKIWSGKNAGHKPPAKTKLKLLKQWPARVMEYIREPENEKVATGLVSFLQRKAWPIPLSDQDSKKLQSHLAESIELDVGGTDNERETQARDEDVTLDITETSSQDLISAFFKESPMIAGKLSACIGYIAQNHETEENVVAAQRYAHTLKGSASLLGVKGVANLTHHLEDILEYLSENPKGFSSRLVQMLQEATDCVESMLDAMQNLDSEPENAKDVLQKVLDWANLMDSGELAEGAVPVEAAGEIIYNERVETPAAEPPVTDIEDQVTAGIPVPTSLHDAMLQAVTSGQATNVGNSSEESGTNAQTPVYNENEETLNVPVRVIDHLFKMIGEMAIKTNQVHDLLRRIQHQENDLQIQARSFQRHRTELEDMVNIQRFATSQRQANAKVNANVTDEEFDSLEMDQYDELHGIINSVIENVLDTNEIHRSIQTFANDLEEVVISQQHLNSELQQIVMNARMIRVDTIVARLQRTVRQTARITNKNVMLEVEGEDLMLDSDILNNLTDPVMHILRNAVDHGIESVQDRQKAGKQAMGRIQLKFSQTGNEIQVVCTDDGRGLDYDRISKTAIEKKLINKRDRNNKKALAKVILSSGFTTRDKVTRISGRGVGMDVVSSAVQANGGTVTVEDNLPNGCRITLQMPINMVTTHSLLVKNANQVFAVPSSSLHQVVITGEDDFAVTDGLATFKQGEETYPAVMLSSLVSEDGKARTSGGIPHVALLIRNETGEINAVLVDQVVSSQKLVIKGTNRYVPKIPGLSGVSILGDGKIVPVMDLRELLRRPAMINTAMFADMESQAAVSDEGFQVLIVDDSISVRRSLTELVEDAGYKALTARNGVEALDILRKQTPDLVLSDLEMPKMTGLELTSNIRADKGFADIPVIMITSRASQKHRKQAEKVGVNKYLTKPYTEDELVDLLELFLRSNGEQANPAYTH